MAQITRSLKNLARELTRLRERPTSARLHGCLVAIAYTDGELDASALGTEVAAHLHPGADPERLAAFLLGLLQAAPDLILHSPELLDALNARLADRKIAVELTEKAKARIAEIGYEPTFGARPLRRAIQKHLQDPLAIRILNGEFREGDKVAVDVDGKGGFTFLREG